MSQRFICKKCSSTSEPRKYVGFWPSERITQAHLRERIIPKYGYHLGLQCSDCGAYNGFIKQDDSMLLIKFYAPNNSTKQMPL